MPLDKIAKDLQQRLTGWTGVVADAIRRRYLTFSALGEVLQGAGG
jgi:hypothetical protein